MLIPRPNLSRDLSSFPRPLIDEPVNYERVIFLLDAYSNSNFTQKARAVLVVHMYLAS
jgi:hypothetical protein